MKKLFVILLFSLSFSVSAHEQWYQCSVQQFYVLGDSGKLEAKAEGYEGEVFRVNRSANVIVGDKINTIYNHEVVASNPDEQGIYSLVNYSRKADGQIRRLLSLTIQDYAKVKPFVLAEGNYIFTGTCR